MLAAPTCLLAGGWDESSKCRRMFARLVSSGGTRKPSLPSARFSAIGAKRAEWTSGKLGWMRTTWSMTMGIRCLSSNQQARLARATTGRPGFVRCSACSAVILVPRASRVALLAYYEHFAARLSFPFDGDFQQRAEPLSGPRCVTVVRLLQKAGVNESDGILCRAVGDKGARGVSLADMRVAPNSVNLQLIADYSYWLRNYR